MIQNYQDIVKGLKIADVSVYIFGIMQQQVNLMFNLRLKNLKKSSFVFLL